MNPGRLNKRVKILKFAKTPDGAGGYLDDWKTESGWELHSTVWAEVHPLRGREFEQAKQSMGEVTHRITIRYKRDIDKSMIVVYNGRRFDIGYAINPEEKNAYLELMCVERV